jgi:hypothetical protein
MAIAKVTDPEGYEVTLEEERWQHIIEGHPEIEKLRDVLLDTLKSPALIQQETDAEEVFLYYRLTGRSFYKHNDIYMVAVVERSEGNKIAGVKTAYLVKQPKKGRKMVWFNLQQK